jgi:uracil-DNA glycosylase family 4
VTDPRVLLRRYLSQQIALGERAVTLPEPVDSPVPPPAADAGPPPSAAATTPGPTESRARPPEPRRPSRESGGAGKQGRTTRARWDVDLPPIPPPGIVIPAPATDLFESDPIAQAPFEEVVSRIHACTRCRLHAGRTNAVPGEGPLDARLVVVGEGPGANEDAQGRPFVGRAGELLNDILAAIDCPRDTVYIANVVKCRPPDNRKPQGDEMEACMPYLHRQLALIRPKVVLAMGATAAEALLQTRSSLGQLRNKVHDYRGTPLVVTYHPAALLRNPNWKRPTWDDVRIARQLLDQ